MTADPAKDAERLAEIRIGGTHLCQHHIMAATCGLCERDATIARLTQERDEARRSAEALPIKLWLWRNGDHFLAFDNTHPTYSGGDPMVLGEPVGYAMFMPSHPATQPSTAGAALQGACSSAVERSAHNGNVAGSTPAARTTHPSAADVLPGQRVNCARYMRLGYCPPNDLCGFHVNSVADVERARALDEAVIEAARSFAIQSGSLVQGMVYNDMRTALIRALAARDAAIRARTGEK